MDEKQDLSDQALAKLQAIWKVTRCAVCGTEAPRWLLSNKVFYLSEYKGRTPQFFGQEAKVFPVVPVSCNVCGNTYFLNAIYLGITPTETASPPPMPAQPLGDQPASAKGSADG